MVDRADGDKSEVTQRENSAAQELGPGDDVARRPDDSGERPQPGADDVQERQPPKIVTSPFDDKRAQVFAKARAERHAADDPALVDEIAASRENRHDPNTVVGRPEGREPPAPKTADTPAAKRKLLVHGREVELSEEEVTAAAQKALAADNILEAAKADRREAQELLEGLRAAQRANPPAPAADTPPAQKPAPATILDESKIADIVDRIQVGDPKEAAAALQTFGEAIEQRLLEKIGNADERIAQVTDTVIENNRRRDATAETLRKFGDDNSDIIGSRRLQAALAQETADLMRTEMRKLGVEDETIETVRKARGVGEAEAIAIAYRLLQQKGHPVPTHEQILSSATAAIRKDFNLPAPRKGNTEQPAPRVPAPPSADMSQRNERKRVLPPQPRRAAPPNPAGEQQDRSREEANRKWLQQTRAFRKGGR